ncbi:MAG: hypothetical protein CL878_13970 [Dehalococcoidia bacterium]|nr:hypothetical protein [Dehalococcoidia bacterium]
MIVAQALAIALCAFGGAVLVGAVRDLRRREATPGRAIALAVVAVGSTGTFLLLTTEYPALLINALLRTLAPTAALPEGRLVSIDLPATAGSAVATLLGAALGLVLTWWLFRIARHGRWMMTALALPLLTVALFVALGAAGAVAALISAPDSVPASRGRSQVTVPPGFGVRRLVTELTRPTVVRFGPDGRLYVGVHTVVGSAGAAGDDFAGEILSYAVTAGQARDPRVFASGLGLVTGMAFRADELYVSHAHIAAQRGEVVALRDTNGDGAADASRPILSDLLAGHYLWHHNQQLAFGPDERLYLGQGGTSDHGPEREPLGGTILVADPDGSNIQVFARGFRNPFGLAFTARGELLVTDNGPDAFAGVAEWTERGAPVDELNLVTAGGHYGYPEAFGFPPPSSATRPPIAIWPPHKAPAGITMYTADQFPKGYRDNAFVVLFLPGEVHRVVLHRDTAGTIQWAEAREFASGLLLPADVTVAPDGSLIVTEFSRGTVLAISSAG